MRRRSSIVLLSLLLASGATAGAEDLTLPQLIRALETSSPDWKREETALFKARSSYQEQRAFLYPTLSFNFPASFSYSPWYDISGATMFSGAALFLANSSSWSLAPAFSLTQALPTSGILDVSVKDDLTIFNPGTPPLPLPNLPATAYSDSLTFNLSVRQPIFFEDAFGASLAVIESSYRLAGARYLSARNELAAQAARAWYGLVRLKHAARLAELALADAKLAVEDARRKLGSGDFTRLDVLKAESREKKAELDLFDAADALRNEYARVAALYDLTRPYDVPDEPVPLGLPDLPAEADVRARVAAANPELAAGRDDLALKKARVTTVKCDNAHTLTLGSNIVLDSVNNYETDLGSALADPFNGSANPRLTFTFKLSFRLFDGGAADERIRQASLDAEMSALSLEGKARELAGRTGAVLSRLERARLNAVYTDAVLDAAVQEFEAGGKDFKLGRIAKLDLDRLQLALQQARLESRQAKSDGDLARLDVFALMGEDLRVLLAGGKR